MDELTLVAASLLAGAHVAKPVVEAGIGAIKSLLGQPLKVAGAMLSDQVYGWQCLNRVKICAAAKTVMDDKGIEPSVLPEGFLIPFLEAAGNVGDEEMQDAWAKLLASSVKDSVYQHPALRRTLAELTPEEAKILVRIARGVVVGVHLVGPAPRYFQSIVTPLILESGCAYPARAEVYIENLRRLSLLHEQSCTPPETPQTAADLKGVLERRDLQPELDQFTKIHGEPSGKLCYYQGLSHMGELLCDACFRNISTMSTGSATLVNQPAPTTAGGGSPEAAPTVP